MAGHIWPHGLGTLKTAFSPAASKLMAISARSRQSSAIPARSSFVTRLPGFGGARNHQSCASLAVGGLGPGRSDRRPWRGWRADPARRRADFALLLVLRGFRQDRADDQHRLVLDLPDGGSSRRRAWRWCVSAARRDPRIRRGSASRTRQTGVSRADRCLGNPPHAARWRHRSKRRRAGPNTIILSASRASVLMPPPIAVFCCTISAGSRSIRW